MTQGLPGPGAVRLRRGPLGLWVQAGGRGQGPRDVHRPRLPSAGPDPAFSALSLLRNRRLSQRTSPGPAATESRTQLCCTKTGFPF